MSAVERLRRMLEPEDVVELLVELIDERIVARERAMNEWLDTGQIEREFKISRAAIRERIRRGTLPATKDGRTVLVRRGDVERVLGNGTTMGQSKEWPRDASTSGAVTEAYEGGSDE